MLFSFWVKGLVLSADDFIIPILISMSESAGGGEVAVFFEAVLVLKASSDVRVAQRLTLVPTRCRAHVKSKLFL